MASRVRNSSTLRSSRSGAASWMNSAFDAIAARSVVKVSVPLGGRGRGSSFCIDGQATSMAALSFASAAGATS